MKIPLVDLPTQDNSLREEIELAIHRVIEQGQFILGPEVNALENELELAERKHADELRKIQMESQARLDSIIRYYEDELASKSGKYGNVAKGTYYLVAGSFHTPAYAESYSAKINQMGYESQIITVGSWNFVAAETYTSWREALDGLNLVRESVSVNAWIYIAR